VTDSPEDLIGCTLVWVRTNSTWKVLRCLSENRLLLEKVSGGTGLTRQGSTAEYSHDNLLRGIEIGAVEVVDSFEVLT
jgi:hypothetical protein